MSVNGESNFVYFLDLNDVVSAYIHNASIDLIIYVDASLITLTNSL